MPDAGGLTRRGIDHPGRWLDPSCCPGVGTIANALLVGVFVDLTLLVVPDAEAWPARVALLILGVGPNGVATALYIGARLGPGPRDGLMTGLVRRSGRSVRGVRTLIEAGVLVTGWLLGGTVGVGTLLYAVAIGPIAHALLPILTVPPAAEVRPGPLPGSPAASPPAAPPGHRPGEIT